MPGLVHALGHVLFNTLLRRENFCSVVLFTDNRESIQSVIIFLTITLKKRKYVAILRCNK